MLHRINRYRCVFISLLLILGVTFLTSGRGMGYIMPAEQIIDFMAKNFSKFKTLVFTQSTHQQDKEVEGDGRIFEEKNKFDWEDQITADQFLPDAKGLVS